MEFLWVRWFGLDTEWDSGPSRLRLDRIGYVPDDDPDAFGFLDPDHVLRACHLIPSFAVGRTALLLAPSMARDDSRAGDWTNYYVNRSVPYLFKNTHLPPDRFVDRDMMMRYLGLGVGHLNAANFPHEIRALDMVHIPDVSIQDTDMDENGDSELDDDSGDEDKGEEEDDATEDEADGLECEF
jgi:hypothetical protein